MQTLNLFNCVAILAAIACCNAASNVKAAGKAEIPNANADISRESLIGYLDVQQKFTNNPYLTIREFDSLYKVAAKYKLYQVDQFVKGVKLPAPPSIPGVPPPPSPRAPSPTPTPPAPVQIGPLLYGGPAQFPWIYLRRSSDDVLSIEQPRLTSAQSSVPRFNPPSPQTFSPLPKNGGGLSFDDLQGALFSYGQNYRASTDSWVAQGALIAPFFFPVVTRPFANDPLSLYSAGIIPSLTFNYFQTTGAANSKNNIGQLTARGGAFASWVSYGPHAVALTLRGDFAYATDNHLDETARAGELELEPQIDLLPYEKGDKLTPQARIGYRSILAINSTDDVLLAIQLRTILHAEFGNVMSGTNTTGVQAGEFLRLGPIIQLDVKPFLLSKLGFSFKLGYLPNLIGNGSRDYQFTADASYDIISNSVGRLSLKLSYFDGGLSLTQRPAQTLVLGLGAAF